MGLLIDSTVFIHAERHRRTAEQLVQDIIERFGDVELAALSRGDEIATDNMRHFHRVPDLVVHEL